MAKHIALLAFLLVLIAIAEATPPGIAKNPSHATCKIKKYKHCYNLVHVCPKFCPDSCTVHCASCKPICGPGPPSEGGDNSPPETPTPSEPTPSTPYPPSIGSPPESSTPSPSTSPPSSPTPNPPDSSSSPVTTPPSSPTPSSGSPPGSSSPPSSGSPPSSPTPNPPTGSPSSSPTPSTSTPSSGSPPPSPSTPSSSGSPPSSPTPKPPTSPSTGPKTARCKNKYYPQCYNIEHVCPNSCPGGCEVDCVTCKPTCTCDRPGAVCQDPRFIGGDGITFYFHGKKGEDFCLVSDPDLHINAHFIGKRNENMKRDFTWVQSIVILFGKHKLFLGATKTSTWYDSVDHLNLTFDGQPLTLPEREDTMWKSLTVPSVSLTRLGSVNQVVVEIEGKLKITTKVVPITEQDSRIHNYGITKDDCFAHLDLAFKFYSLSSEVNGVLGQTYRPDYVNRVNVGAKMPVVGGDKHFATSSLFAADCAVARFIGGQGSYIKGPSSLEAIEFPNMDCASGIDGYGVVCKR